MSSLKGSVSSPQSLSGGSAINIAVTPNITIGEVTTLAPNSSVVVELAENSTRMNPVFNFGIPEGKKGEKGDAGSIKFIIVNELPTENIDDSAIYMIPSNNPDTTNTYEEFIYVNGTWESLGSANVEVNLADYVKNTDFASNSKTGVIQVSGKLGLSVSQTNGLISIVEATQDQILEGTSKYNPITPNNLDYAVGSVLPVMTQAQYDALETKNENLYYFIVEE